MCFLVFFFLQAALAKKFSNKMVYDSEWNNIKQEIEHKNMSKHLLNTSGGGHCLGLQKNVHLFLFEQKIWEPLCGGERVVERRFANRGRSQ